MKKYIAPNAKTILLGSESSIMVLTGSINTQAEDVDVMSNERTASSSIWGEE